MKEKVDMQKVDEGEGWHAEGGRKRRLTCRRWTKEKVGMQKVDEGEGWHAEGGRRRRLTCRRCTKEKVDMQNVDEGEGWHAEGGRSRRLTCRRCTKEKVDMQKVDEGEGWHAEGGRRRRLTCMHGWIAWPIRQRCYCYPRNWLLQRSSMDGRHGKWSNGLNTHWTCWPRWCMSRVEYSQLDAPICNSEIYCVRLALLPTHFRNIRSSKIASSPCRIWYYTAEIRISFPSMAAWCKHFIMHKLFLCQRTRWPKWSAVESRTRNQARVRARVRIPLWYRFEGWAFSFSPFTPSWLSYINEYLAIDSGGYVSDLVVARNCCMARILPGVAELVSEWTGLPGGQKV